MNTDHALEQLVANRCPGGFTMVDRHLAQVLGLRDAYMLAVLLDCRHYADDRGHLDDGWFLLTREYVSTRHPLTPRQQTDSLASLKARGLVAVSMRGNPARRYVRVRLLQVAKLYGSGGAETSTPPTAGCGNGAGPGVRSSARPYSTTPQTGPTLSDRPPTASRPDGGAASLGLVDQPPAARPPTTQQQQLAHQLHQALCGHLGPTHPNLRRYDQGRWAKQLDDLTRLDGVPPDTVARVLVWYCDHLGERYVPVAQSGTSFRAKFPAIQDAMGRDPVAQVGTVSIDANAAACRLAGPTASRDLATTIQAVADSYGAWLARLRALDTSNNFNLQATAQSLPADLGGPMTFAEHWVRRGLELGMTGQALAWQADHPGFVRQVQAISERATGGDYTGKEILRRCK